MFYTRGLLLKGILGFGAASAATFGGLTQKERIAGWFSSGEETAKPAEAITEEVSKLLENVGLECQNLETATADNGVVCSKKTGDGAKNIRVKREGSTEFNVSTLPADSGGGKIKLYKLGEDKGENGYASGLKLVIEEGNINGGDSNNKLEEFETYEIKDETNSSNPATKAYYLNRKTKASDKIKVLLGLDTCDFPEGANATQSCNLTTEQIKKINFEGKDGEVTGTGTLQISIASANETQDFPYGFKFTLTPSSGDITINRGSQKGALTLNNGVATIFNIKKTGSSLTLEEALTKDVLTAKVGLQCNGEASATGVDCSKAGDGNIKVKQDSTDFDVTTAPTGNTKIKLYKAESTDGYNKGLKFVIEGGDIGSNGNKLEEFETYEIKEDSSSHKYYLTRKDKSKDSKRKILGLPDTCTFPESSSTTPVNCSVDSTNIDKIKFDGKTGATLTGGSGGTATLKVEVTPSTETTDFPHGFKFTLTPGSGSTLTINKGSETITIKANEGKEFKIKKTGTSLTLEKAWTLTTLASKVGLTCTESGGSPTETSGVNCTKASGDTKVKKNGSSDFNVSTISGGKIKAYKTSTSETYNEGFKFVIEENDINGSGSSSKLEQFETYEIKKETDGWKLVRKSDAKVGIKKALGLDQIDGCDLPTDSTAGEKTCDLDQDKFKKINFEGKNDSEMTGGNSAKLKISKQSGSENGDFGPFGYKFKLESSEDAKISSSLTIAGNTNTEFKIKRQTNSNNITLEKAWTAESLGAKVGLTCQKSGTKDCSLGSGSKINVKDGSNTRKQASFKTGSESKKLTYTEDQKDYNQGIKFTTSQEICLENGTPESGTPNSIENGDTGYEIKKDGDDWFLIKKSAPAA